jgi:hypothetical protein
VFDVWSIKVRVDLKLKSDLQQDDRSSEANRSLDRLETNDSLKDEHSTQVRFIFLLAQLFKEKNGAFIMLRSAMVILLCQGRFS